MGKVLLIMFVLGTFCVSACGSIQNNKNKVVQIDDKKVVASEIKAETLTKLQELKKQSKETYLLANDNARMIELREKEMAQLKSYRLQIEQEAELQTAASKKQLEEEYQLRLFNLRMQLESIRMGSKNRESLLSEMKELQLERASKLAILEKEKQDYVDVKMKAYKAEMQQRLDVAAEKVL